MSREIDFENVTDEDVPYIVQRPWLAEQITHQGHRLPQSYYDAVGKDAPSEPEAEFVAEGGTPPEIIDQQTQEAIATGQYQELTNNQLRELLDERGLPTGGNKSELITRLEEDDAAGGEDEDEDEETDEDEEEDVETS